MQEIDIKIERDGSDSPALSTDDLLTIVEKNRDRIRTLSSLVVSVCGLLLSAALVVLFFVLKERILNLGSAVPVLLLVSVGALVVAILLSVWSALAAKPEAVRTKLQLLDLTGCAYYRERKRVLMAVVFLLLGVGTFTLSMAMFAFQAVR